VIGVIDYGLGNVNAFLNCYKELNMSAVAVSDPKTLDRFSHLILPGVGAFDEAMNMLKKTGFGPAILKAMENKSYLLGVCVGMQVLGESSDEGVLPGLGLIPGKVLKFQGEDVVTPHMGWNQVSYDQKHPVFAGFCEFSPEFYFLHSFYFSPTDNSSTVAVTDYIKKFSSAVNKERVFGFQFHPEKSHENGRLLLKNFANLGV
jgi:imidazole glycerol-phosphate synthase subunit HisH